MTRRQVKKLHNGDEVYVTRDGRETVCTVVGDPIDDNQFGIFVKVRFADGSLGEYQHTLLK